MKKELLQKHTATTEEKKTRLVTLFLGSKDYELSANWKWDLTCDNVFCSEGFTSLPSTFIGTNSILHPDDKEYVLDAFASFNHSIPFLQFKIITTYGEIKTLTGKNISVCEIDSLFVIPNEERLVNKEEILFNQPEAVRYQMKSFGLTAHMIGVGTWYFNTAAKDFYYSHEMYLIYGLPPHGLNAHLHTFSPYIHPDDQEIVVDVINTAFEQQLPLHIDYRIIYQNVTVKMVRLMTQWQCNEEGNLIMYGMLQDISLQQEIEANGEKEQFHFNFQSKLLQLTEQLAVTAYWYINLITRKIVYSDSMYRLHGVKPKSIPAGINIFQNFVHPEEREVVMEATNKILSSHLPPDLTYWITRFDGKQRCLKQRGKMVVYGENEMVMIVTVQDITNEVTLSKKIATLSGLLSMQQAILLQAEKTGMTGSWIWDLTDEKLSWSDNIFSLLGFNVPPVDFNLKSLIRIIHQGDRKQFNDELNHFINDRKERQFNIRIIRKGEERWMKASFRLLPETELFLGVLQDVSEISLLQTELTARNSRLESLCNNFQDYIIITDVNNNIILWNNRCEEGYSIKKSEALNNNFFDVLPALKEEKTLVQFAQVLKGQSLIEYAERVAGLKGFFDHFMIPVKSGDGEVNGILHLIHDVTNEQNMQSRLTERLNIIEGLLESSVDRIMVMDRYMNYLYCNQKAADFYGLSKEEIIGRNVLELFPDASNVPSFEHFKKALKGERVHLPAIEGIDESLHFEVTLIPVKDDNQKVTEVLWIHHDLSEVIRIHQKLNLSNGIINSIDGAFIELDADFRIRYLNPSGEEFLGKKIEEVVGKKLTSFVPDLLTTKDYNLLVHNYKEGKKTTLEYHSLLLQRWVYLFASPTSEGLVLLFHHRKER